MTIHELNNIDVIIVEGDHVEVAARTQAAEQIVGAVAAATADLHPVRTPVSAIFYGGDLESILDEIEPVLTPIYSAALARSRALHAADVAKEDALNLVRSGAVTKSEAAETLGVTRQTLDRWLGDWRRAHH